MTEQRKDMTEQYFDDVDCLIAARKLAAVQAAQAEFEGFKP